MAALWKVFVVVILATFTQVFADRPTGPQRLGAWSDAEGDGGIQKALQFAISEYNKASNDMYISKVHRIISSRKQVVAGMKYYMEIEVVTTSCKTLDSTLTNCPNQENMTSKIQRCTFEVLSVPWLKTNALKYSFCR
ncbi:hypothetical protein FKM82_010492 [Ascaphus truei]